LEASVIPCTELIPEYSELFKCLESRGGKEAVLDFWRYLSDSFLHNLRDLVAASGIRGCWLYWNQTLNEEAADFAMELEEEAGVFAITMHRCPSKGILLEPQQAARPDIPGIEPYHDYCGHCDLLYRRVLEPLGYEYLYDMTQVDHARCQLVVRRRP
jgi:hypothetical protein